MDCAVSRDIINQIEALLPILFRVRGRGELEAANSAEALMRFVDQVAYLDVEPANTGHLLADVAMLRQSP